MFCYDSNMEPGLYIVGTPIGNLEDITVRALETLRSVDCIYAEDTRRTGILLSRYEIQTPRISCHKFNEASRLEHLKRAVEGGKAVALVTDAGMPCLSDPGARIIRGCREADIPVTVIPGPSSIGMAAAWSGWIEGAFHFEGFLPQKKGKRAKRLLELSQRACPVILFESPYRVQRLLEQLNELAPNRRLFVAREMTKKFEESFSGTPGDILTRTAEKKMKGEFVIVLASLNE